MDAVAVLACNHGRMQSGDQWPGHPSSLWNEPGTATISVCSLDVTQCVAKSSKHFTVPVVWQEKFAPLTMPFSPQFSVHSRSIAAFYEDGPGAMSVKLSLQWAAPPAR